MSTSPASAPSVRCPACSAYIRAGSDWCTLCYADLRAKPDPAPVSPLEPPPAVPADPAAAESVGHPDVESLVADVVAPAESKPRGKHAKQAAEAPVFGEPTQLVDDAEIDAIADRMLAQLAGQRENPLGKLSSIVDSKGKQVALMVGGGVAAVCVLFLLMALVGSFV